MKVKQFFTSLQDAKLIIGITLKAYENLVQLIDKRLTTDLVNMYATNFDDAGNMIPGEPPSESRSMRIFSELRSYQQRLQACGDFVVALLAQEGPASSAESLLREYTIVKSKGVEVVPFVRQMVISRGVAALAARGEFETIMGEVDHRKKGEFGFNELGKEEAASLQRKVILETVWSFAKVEGEKNNKACTKVSEALEKLRTFVSSIPQREFILDAEIQTEVDKFRTVLFCHKLEDANKITDAEKLKESMLQNKSGAFHKCLTVYATGITARTQADKFFETIHSDKGHFYSLQEIIGQVGILQNLQVSDFVYHAKGGTALGGVMLPPMLQSRILDVSKKYKAITATASGLFNTHNKESLDKVSAFLLQCAGYLIEAAEFVFNSRVKTFAHSVQMCWDDCKDDKPLTAERADGLLAALRAACERLTVVPDSELAVLKDLAGPEKHKEYIDGAATTTATCAMLQKSMSFVPLIIAAEPDFKSDAGMQLFDSLEALCQISKPTRLHGSTPLLQVKSTLELRFSTCLRDHLLSSLQRIEPFVAAVMDEKKSATEVISAAARKGDLKKVDSDLELETDSMASLDDKARMAQECLNFTGMSLPMLIGKQEVPMPIAVLLPQLYRASRACEAISKPPEDIELPEHLEFTLGYLRDF